MAGSLAKTVMMKIVADDADAEEKLDRITLKADELRDKHPELTVRIDTAEATAKLAVFREELKRATSSMTADVKVKAGKRGLLGTLLLGAAEGAQGGGGNSGSVLSGFGSLFSGGLTSPIGIAAIAAAIATLLPELAALASGFTAATLGLGAFAIFAIPTLDKIKNAYTGISAAQKTYQQAVLKEKDDPTKTNAAAVAKALLGVKMAWQGLSGPQRDAVKDIQALDGTYHRLAKTLEPDMFRVFNQGLKVADELLPQIRPFADTAARALAQVAGQLGKFFQATTTPGGTGNQGIFKQALPKPQLTGWGQFIQYMKQLEGPALGAIAKGFGQIGGALGHLLTVMSQKDVVHGIALAFDFVTAAIDTLTVTVRVLMKAWDIWGRAAQDVQNWQRNVVIALAKVVAWFNALPGKIVKALSNLGGALFKAGENALSGLLGGLQSRGSGVLSWVENFASNIASTFANVLLMHSPSRVFAQHGANIVAGLVQGLDSAEPTALAAIGRLGGNLSGRVAGVRSGAGGGGLIIEIHAPNGTGYMLPPQFWTELGNGIRTRGGSPAILTRKVVLA